MKYDALGTRMKKYEYVSRNHLVNRCPVIVRLDGKASTPLQEVSRSHLMKSS